MKRFAFMFLFLACCATAKNNSSPAVPKESCATDLNDTCTIPLVVPPVPEVAATKRKAPRKNAKKATTPPAPETSAATESK